MENNHLNLNLNLILTIMINLKLEKEGIKQNNNQMMSGNGKAK